MSQPKDKYLYNYLVNTLGISKEMVLEYVQARLEDLVAKHIKDRLESNYFERLIINQIAYFLQNGFQGRYFYDRTAFEVFVKKCLRDILEKKVNEEMSIEVKLVRKDKSVIHRF